MSVEPAKMLMDSNIPVVGTPTAITAGTIDILYSQTQYIPFFHILARVATCSQTLTTSCLQLNIATSNQNGVITAATHWNNKQDFPMRSWAEGPVSGGCKCHVTSTCATRGKCNVFS